MTKLAEAHTQKLRHAMSRAERSKEQALTEQRRDHKLSVAELSERLESEKKDVERAWQQQMQRQEEEWNAK